MNLFNYLEATDSLIDKIIKKETSKSWYKPTKIPEMADKLKAIGVNELGVAVGIELSSKGARKPYWEINDVVDIFLNKSDLIDDKYKEIMFGENKFNIQQIEKKAKEIAQNIQKNESERIKEIANLLSKKKPNSIMVHELSDAQLNSFYKAVVGSIEELEVLIDDFKTEHVFTFDPEENKLFTSFMNDLTGHMTENNLLIKEIQLAIKELNDLNADSSVPENKRVAIKNKTVLLNKYNDEIKNFATKYIIWPEPDFAIKSIADFKNYINHIKSQRKSFEKAMYIYKKRMDKDYNKLGD